MRTADFDYHLPPELIAQKPARQRDRSRLLVFDRTNQQIEHRAFNELTDYLKAGDVLVLNNSRVMAARLRGENARTGGQFEILLLRENGINDWWAMMRPGKRARLGSEIAIGGQADEKCVARARVVEVNEEGHRRLRFEGVPDLVNLLEAIGEVPLPPYIERADKRDLDEDRERYQTVYAQPAGSVAAPTAGLHFTQELLERLRAGGVSIVFVTLHVGLGTFAPVKSASLEAHRMHEERFELPEEAARVINAAKAAGRRVIAVGTTTFRVLESRGELGPSSAGRQFRVRPGSGTTGIFVYPPYAVKIVDALLTNFHLPRSTLLMLVSAFAAPNRTLGREQMLKVYEEAIRQRYRFFSYGDAMLIL
jgi:S-adenosylmethionine:tRNA ribosyltransferase-isomerase